VRGYSQGEPSVGQGCRHQSLACAVHRYEESAGEGEVNESVRGTGVQHAVGELLSCPFCLAVWISGGLTAGLVLAPRATRLVLTALTAVAGSDAIQLVYDRAKP
jgi:hypothetical protein